jgi:acetate kinase
MNASTQSVLTINAGSSSIKFARFTIGAQLQLTLCGQIERIGSTSATFSTEGVDHAMRSTRPVEAADHAAATTVLTDWITTKKWAKDLVAIAHRVVHGGPNFHAPQRLTTAVLDELRGLAPWDPAHLPEEIGLIEAFQRRYENLPQVICFDTAFHQELPRVATLLAIPRRYQAQGVRRYGFHGLSYEYLMSELDRIDGGAAGRGRIILVHLGNGASLAAVHDGKPIDTSMGFTSASGVMMGTRCGDIDPGLVAYLARADGLDADGFDALVNKQSGLLGVSETSADMRDLLLHEANDPRAADAVSLFCYQIRKWIGAFAAAMGGLDRLVFAGGIGEHSPVARARICDRLGFLGIDIDANRNARSDADARVISSDAARVTVHVIPTNEALVMARAACRVLALDEIR